MAARNVVSIDSLKVAFSLAEEQLRGEMNRSIAESIVNEKGRVQYEDLLDKLYVSAFKNVFPNHDVRKGKRGRPDLDIWLTYERQVVTAIECKGIVSNAGENDVFSNSLDVTGIRNKIWPNQWIKNTLTSDIEGIKDKIPNGAAYPIFEFLYQASMKSIEKGRVTESCSMLKTSRGLLILNSRKREELLKSI